MIDADDIVHIIGTTTLLLALLSLILFIAGNQQHINVDDLCKQCGYSKATDTENLLDYTIFPVVSKVECDKKKIISVDYPIKESKWGESPSFDFNKPSARCL